MTELQAICEKLKGAKKYQKQDVDKLLELVAAASADIKSSETMKATLDRIRSLTTQSGELYQTIFAHSDAGHHPYFWALAKAITKTMDQSNER